MALQGKEKNIIDLSETVFSFEAKLRLFVYDLENKKFNHFPRVKANVISIKEENLNEYKEKLKELQANFKHRFEDLKSYEIYICIFCKPIYL